MKEVPGGATPVWRGGRGWIIWILATALLLLVATGIGIWWWRQPAVLTPPMPVDIQDPAVVKAIERARQEVVDDVRSSDAWGHLAMVLLAHLFDREATSCFEQASRLDPEDPRWVYGCALIALKRDPDNALGILRNAARLAVSSPTFRSGIRLQLAEALLERRELDEAATLLQNEQSHHPGNPRVTLDLGLLALARGELQSAKALLTSARSSPYARKIATAQLAAISRTMGDVTDQYEKELAGLPEDPPWPDPLLDEVVRLQVGQRGLERRTAQLEKEGRFAEAAELFLTQLQVQRTSRACVGAGINLARIKDYDRALPLLHEGVALEPDNALAQYTLALALFARAERRWSEKPGANEQKKEWREVIRYAQRAAELKPDYAAAYLIWGLALRYVDGAAAAIVPLRKGVECRPIDFELQLALGETLLSSGEPRKALPHLQAARELNPNDPRPLQALQRLQEARPANTKTP